MRLVVTTESRFVRDPEGRVWTDCGIDYTFWRRYLDVFDSVVVIARARESGAGRAHGSMVNGPRVSVAAVPHYTGTAGFMLNAPAVLTTVQRTVRPGDAILYRVPSPIANLVWRSIARDQRPFGVEVIGDPDVVFGGGVIRHPLRPLMHRWTTRHLRAQCGSASAVAYVTEGALQQKYPPGSGGLSTGYSSIELGSEAFAGGPRPQRLDAGTPYVIVTVGSLEQNYKGVDVLISAAADCRRRGLHLALRVVGDGRLRPALERQAASEGVECDFTGQLPGPEAVRAALDAADLFVLPSRTEGLPRALIEAMARALPCIGSHAGGIPELLDAEDMVAPGDAAALAAKMAGVIRDAARRERMAARNLRTAAAYRSAALQRRRVALYSHLRRCTERWLERTAQCPERKIA